MQKKKDDQLTNRKEKWLNEWLILKSEDKTETVKKVCLQ